MNFIKINGSLLEELWINIPVDCPKKL